MSDTKIIEISKAISDDWKGPGYIKDPNILASFLKEKFEPLTGSVTIEEVAQSIVDDFNGAGYYQDSKILTEYLEGKLKLR